MITGRSWATIGMRTCEIALDGCGIGFRESMSTNFAGLGGAADPSDGFFHRWAWLYALWRERFFADHTEAIAELMRVRCCPEDQPLFVELGCGPGFYSAELAKMFPEWRMIGVDRSVPLLERARRRTAVSKLTNCSFLLGNAMQLGCVPEQADFVLASRLLLILPDRPGALANMYAALKPGGALLIAEPLKGWRTEIPLACMRLLDRITSPQYPQEQRHVSNKVLTRADLGELLRGQPWIAIDRWSDERYQYALCEKAPAAVEQRA